MAYDRVSRETAELVPLPPHTWYVRTVGWLLEQEKVQENIKNVPEIIFFCDFMLFFIGFWLQVGGSQGSPWRPLEAHLLTLGGLDWLLGLTLGVLDWHLGPRWPQDPPKRTPKTDFCTQHGPQTLSKRPNLAQLGSNKAPT